MAFLIMFKCIKGFQVPRSKLLKTVTTKQYFGQEDGSEE
jgi:hypothetical protein